MIDYRVYLVTDEPSRYAGNWLDTIMAAVEGGVTCVQYRDTESTDTTKWTRLRALQDALRARGIPLIVNNDVHLAHDAHAEGVHVGQSDMPPDRVRQIVGKSCEIGLSITQISQLSALRAYRAAGAVDAIGIGPVFDARKTKCDAANAMGLEGLASIVGAVPDMANCAIGWITLANAARIVQAGAKGLALVSAFSQAEDPCAVARQLRDLFV